MRQKAKHFFSENRDVAYQIRGKWSIELDASTCYVLQAPAAPWIESEGKKNKFLKVVMLHIKLKATERRAPCKHILCSYTHPQPVG